MLTSIGRAAYRRVLFPGTNKTGRLTLHETFQVRKLTVSLLRGTPASAKAGNETTPIAPAKSKKAKSPAAKKSTGTQTKGPKKPKETAVKKKDSAARAAKKKAPKPTKPKRPARQLSPEAKLRQRVKELKVIALLKPEPTRDMRLQPWTVFTQESLTKSNGLAVDKMKELSQQYHQLSASQLEDLKTRAHAKNMDNKEKYVSWVESHATEEIALANLARKELNRKTSKNYKLIKDGRQPSHPASAYNLYLRDRLSGRAVGNAIHATFADAVKDWKALSEDEKEPYKAIAEAEASKYRGEAVDLAGKVADLRKQKRMESAKSKSPKNAATQTNEIGL